MTSLRLSSIRFAFQLSYFVGGLAAIVISIALGFNREHIGFAFVVGVLVTMVGVQAKKLTDMSTAEMESLWNEAKKHEA